MKRNMVAAIAFLTLGASGCSLAPLNASPVDLPISVSEPHPWTGRILSFKTDDLYKQYGFQEWTQHPGQSPEVMPYDRLAGKRAKVEGEVAVDIYGTHYFLKCRLIDGGEPIYFAEVGKVALDLAPDGTDFDGDLPPGAFTVKSEYDKFKDLTVVTIPVPQTSYRFDFIRPQFSAFAIYKGRKLLSSPGNVGINFFSQSEDWEYLECHEVNILADDQRIPIEETKHDGTVGDGYVLEYINSRLGWKEVKMLSAAKTVEVKICNTKLKLNPQNMADLKEFVRLLTPSSTSAN